MHDVTAPGLRRPTTTGVRVTPFVVPASRHQTHPTSESTLTLLATHLHEAALGSTRPPPPRFVAIDLHDAVLPAFRTSNPPLTLLFYPTPHGCHPHPRSGPRIPARPPPPALLPTIFTTPCCRLPTRAPPRPPSQPARLVTCCRWLTAPQSLSAKLWQTAGRGRLRPWPTPSSV